MLVREGAKNILIKCMQLYNQKVQNSLKLFNCLFNLTYIELFNNLIFYWAVKLGKSMTLPPTPSITPPSPSRCLEVSEQNLKCLASYFYFILCCVWVWGNGFMRWS